MLLSNKQKLNYECNIICPLHKKSTLFYHCSVDLTFLWTGKKKKECLLFAHSTTFTKVGQCAHIIAASALTLQRQLLMNDGIPFEKTTPSSQHYKVKATQCQIKPLKKMKAKFLSNHVTGKKSDFRYSHYSVCNTLMFNAFQELFILKSATYRL